MEVVPAERTRKKRGGPRQPWSEPEGYRIELQAYITELDRYLQAATDDVVYFTYAKRVDRLSIPVKTITGEIGNLLAPFRGLEWPLWPAAYVPCGANGRALYYMSEGEKEVLRNLMTNCRPKILERLKTGKCMVAGINAARLLAGFPEMRQYVVADTKGAEPGSGPCCMPYPCEWHKLHGDDLIPLHNKLTVIFGEGFPDLQTFERQINGAFRRVRISVGLWVHANVPPDKRDKWRQHIAESMRRPETFTKLSFAKKKMYEDRPELREQVGERMKELWDTRRDEQCQLISDAMVKPEVKKKQCSGITKKWEDKQWSDQRRKKMSTQGPARALAMRKAEEAKPDTYCRAKSDAISKAKRRMSGNSETLLDDPKAMRLHVPLKLTDSQLGEVLVLLQKRHAECCVDPSDKHVFWAICIDGNLRRGARAVRTLLDKFSVTRSDLPSDWQGIFPPSSMPGQSSAAASSSA